MNMKAKCPYCGRKISYGVRFMERGNGEHFCKSCKKPSNIVQDKKIWILFTITAIFSLIVLMFYFAFSGIVQHAYNTNGDYGVMVALFFGKYKTLKWVIWEIIPYIVFFFVSPLFVNFQMQKKYAYTSADHIDLGTDFIPPLDNSETKESGSTRVIPKVGVTKVDDNYTFENISSNSGKNVSDTKSFSIKSDVTQIDPESYVKSASYRSDAPLKKVEHSTPSQHSAVPEQTQELYRVKVLREQELKRQELQAQAKSMDSKSSDKNYSGNRKF